MFVKLKTFISSTACFNQVKCLSLYSPLMAFSQKKRQHPHEYLSDINQIYELIYPERKTHEHTTLRMVQIFQPYMPGRDTMQSYLAFKYLNDQRFKDDFTAQVGPEMAAAYFVTKCRGKLRFENCDVWFDNFWSARGFYHASATAVNITEVDLSAKWVLYEGLEHLMYLKKLKWLSLRDSPTVNDWHMDRITGPAFQNLEYLDISGCSLVNSRGIECLAKLKSLRHLSLFNMGHIRHLPLLCLLLEDALPAVTIAGLDYMVPPPVSQLILLDHEDQQQQQEEEQDGDDDPALQPDQWEQHEQGDGSGGRGARDVRQLNSGTAVADST